MRKVIAAINMSLDGIFDHDKMNPGEEVHDYFSKLLDDAGILLYGRVTYGLMRFWQTLLKNPSGERSMDDFAKAIDRVDKLVFSSTLHDTGWSTAQIARTPLPQTTTRQRHLSRQRQHDKTSHRSPPPRRTPYLHPSCDRRKRKIFI